MTKGEHKNQLQTSNPASCLRWPLANTDLVLVLSTPPAPALIQSCFGRVHFVNQFNYFLPSTLPYLFTQLLGKP